MVRLPPGGNGKSNSSIAARKGVPATAEHARHVVEIIEAAYRAGETGQTQTLTTTFTPVEGA